ncbi:MAG: sulfate transporter CysZ [Methylococcales symbiont of Hymedesmia sp. n. MRB-2018]|nr:MAG: sulfate transporter CysZ [Methylococcales symbiont of Hymedesmia sp. n. MRB-2018]KAF3984476.1 MAG: sulfate transporter CysZ [Methylococcales symbiont of Hymedesmia sp. n. MRB-2018]
MRSIKNGDNPVYAASCLIQGVKLLSSPQLRKYLLIPVLINLVLYSIAFTLAYLYLSDLIDQIIPRWLSWLEWLIWPIFFISFSVIGFFSFTIFANIIASPFYSQLSVKTWELISAQQSSVKEQAVRQVILAEIKRVAYLLSRMLPLLILFIIPLINLIAPLLWGLFGAWGIALEFMAYPLENQGLLFEQQKQQARSQRWAMLSFGGIVMLGLSIPVINLIVAPVAVIAATVYHFGLTE